MENIQFAAEGARFKEARKALGVTQKELAEITGISLPTIKHYEQGVRIPKITYARMLEKAGINMNFVMKGIGPPLLNKQIQIPAQHSHSSALRIEQTPARYDLNTPTAKTQNNDSSHELAAMRLELELNKAKMETLKLQAELAQKEAEIAKAQARAEIAEARLQIQQSQTDDLQLMKDLLKGTEEKLAQTQEALDTAKAEITHLKKNSRRAA